MSPEQMHHFKDKRVRVDESWMDGHKSRIIESPDSFPLQSTGSHLLIQFAEGLGLPPGLILSSTLCSYYVKMPFPFAGKIQSGAAAPGVKCCPSGSRLCAAKPIVALTFSEALAVEISDGARPKFHVCTLFSIFPSSHTGVELLQGLKQTLD